MTLWILAITLLVISGGCFVDGEGAKERAERQERCKILECARTGISSKERRGGRHVCHNGDVDTMCEYKCLELPIPDKASQTACFCEMCKRSGDHGGFCAKRKDGWGNLPPIKPEECEEKVCKEYNLVRYRDNACGYTGEEEEDWGPAPPGHDEPDADLFE